MLVFWFIVSILLINHVETTYRSKFYGEVESDSFLYTKTVIPRHARSHSISIWAESPHLNPIVLLRYDGIPTMKLYDAMISVPVLPAKLLLVDKEPTQGVLFMAIYGGTEINKYRYFAGSPSNILVGVETTTDLCPNEFYSGRNCSYVENLSLSGIGKITSTTITTNIDKYYTIIVPSRTENVFIKVNYEHIVLDICKLYFQNQTLPRYQLHLQVYLDQPNEEYNSAQQSISLVAAELCKETKTTVVAREVAVFLPRPLSGVWTVVVSMRRLVDNYNSTSSGGNTSSSSNSSREIVRDSGSDVSTSDIKHKFKYQIYHDTAASSTTTSTRSSSALDKVYTEYIDTSSWSLDITTSSTTCAPAYTEMSVLPPTTACSLPVIPMDSVRTPWVADGYYSLYSNTKGLLTIQAESTSNPLSHSTSNPLSEERINQTRSSEFVLFSTQLPTVLYTSMLGGGTVIALHVYIPHNVHTKASIIQQIFNSLNFQIAVRAGGLPKDPTESMWDSGNGENDRDSGNGRNETATASSPNAFILYSDNAIVIDSKIRDSDSTSDVMSNTQQLSTQNLLQRVTNNMIYTKKHEKQGKQSHHQYKWESQETEETQDSTYSRTYTWTIHRPAIANLYAAGREGLDTGAELFMRVSGIYDRETSTELAAVVPVVEVGLSVVLEPCLKDTCIHGRCYTQQGDVSVSSCSCRYPWAGEACDVLSISYTLYIVQMVLLVVSNCAMVPAVIFSLQQHYYFVATLLSISSISSGLYHLCDSDVYCIAGLNFHSLQVLDVLSSVSSISCILLLYAPISKHIHAALSLLCIAVLVAFVTNDPTSPVNIAIAGCYALGICGCGWAYVYLWPSTVTNSEKQSTASNCCSKKSFQHNRNNYHEDSVLIKDTSHITSQDREVVYSALSLQEHAPLSAHSMSGDDLEMSTLRVNTQGQRSFTLDNPTSSDGEQDNESDLSIPTSSRSLGLIDPRLQMPVAGMFLGLLGLMCFALQGRDDYYILHSMWHVLMMLSAYLLLRGRVDVSSYMM